MTVTDRTTRPRTAPASGPAAPVAREVRALLAAADRRDGSRPLLTTTLPIDALDPIELFAAARAQGLEAALWLQPRSDRSIVGDRAGMGRRTRGARPVHDRDRRLAGGPRGRHRVRPSRPITARPVRPSSAVLASAAGHRRPDDPWAPFGAASLVLPTFGVASTGRDDQPDRGHRPGSRERCRSGRGRGWWDALAREATAGEEGPAASAPTGGPAPTTGALEIVAERPDRAGWERTVGLFAGAVGRGRIDKAVLARRVATRAATDLDIAAALRHLASSAPESTTFAFTRDGTTFLGATPERLVRTVGRSFETVAIAGSAARGADADEDARLAAALLASEKDREEHAVVVETLRVRPRADRRVAPRRREPRDPAAPARPAPRDADHRDASRRGRPAGARRPAPPDAGGRRRAARGRARPHRRARRVRSRLVRRVRSAGWGPTATAS